MCAHPVPDHKQSAPNFRIPKHRVRGIVNVAAKDVSVGFHQYETGGRGFTRRHMTELYRCDPRPRRIDGVGKSRVDHWTIRHLDGYSVYLTASRMSDLGQNLPSPP